MASKANKEGDFLWVYMTFPEAAEAERICKRLLVERLIACANLFPSITSLYWWEKKIEKSQEVVVVAKSQRRLWPRLEKVVLEEHSYDCPCLVALEAKELSSSYKKWLVQELGGVDS